jgi:hypothetical protein
MRPSILASASTLALGLILVFVPPFSLAKRITYLLDQRPERLVLFIGNARTSSNDMPEMLLHIADSAGYANKLRIEMHGSGDQSTTFHGADPQVHALLAQGWDHVVLQAQSNEQIDRPNWGKWLRPAADLIEKAKQAAASPAMFVTWRYTEQCPADLSWNAAASAAMHQAIQQHAWLAETTDVDLINVGLVWEKVQADRPKFSLYADCSLPSVYGSYLAALMFYAQLLDGDLAPVTFKPDLIEAEQAELLRMAVSDTLASGLELGSSDNQPVTSKPISRGAAAQLDNDAKPRISAKCIWGIFAEMQAARQFCDQDTSDVDEAIDKALLRIEAHLIAAKELEPRAQGYYQRIYHEDPEFALQVCESASSIKSTMTIDSIEKLTAQILSAGPEDFSADCI